MAVDETVKFKSIICCSIVVLLLLIMSTKISTDESNPVSSSVTVNMLLLNFSSAIYGYV